MGSILAFFGAGTFRLQALLIGAAALAVLCMSLVAWALLERTWRLEAENEVTLLEADLAICGGKLETQNEAIKGWKAAADAAKGRGVDAKAAADKVVQGLKPELSRLEGRIGENIKAQVKRTCTDATAEVRKGLKP